MYISSQSFELQDGILDNSTVNIEDDSVKRQWTGASILGKRNRNERCPSLKNPLPRKIRNPSSLRSTESPPVHAFRLPTPPFVHRPLEYSQDVEQLTTFISYQRLDRSPPAKYRRRVATPKRPRPARAYTDPIAPQITAIQVLLTPCHICHKAPRLKKDLEAYEDCWRCKERTCYVCIRQCQARCGSRKICRGCCVENGEEGHVYCFDCLRTCDHVMEE